MSVDKFGRHSSSHVYTEPGVSVRYVNNNFLRRDGSNEAEGELNLSNNKIINVANPTSSLDAVNKNYVDNRKPVITIWACHEGPLHSDAYEWSFGGGFAPRKYGYPMPTSGRIIRMTLSSKRDTSPSRPRDLDRDLDPGRSERSVRAIFIINGNVNLNNSISLHPGRYVISLPFIPPIELSAGDHINFRTTTCNGNEIYSTVSLLIQLDI